MSGTAEDRWRNSRGQHFAQTQAQSNQQSNPGASRTASSGVQSHIQSDSEPQQVLKAMSGNVWTGNDRGGRDGRAPTPNYNTPKGFNAQQTREVLKKGFESVAAGDQKALRYKAPTGVVGNKSGGPWASRPNTMGSGKDFFLELRKQVSTLQQSERTGG